MTEYINNGTVGLQVTQGQQLGIGLGSTINANVNPNAPLNPAIPYLYFNSSSGVGATFGNVSVGLVQTNISVIVNPADPMFYIGAVLPLLPVFSSAGFGLSAKGQIAMPLNQKPSHYNGGTSFSGNVYAQLEVNIPTPVPGLAVNVNGAVDLNLNAEGDNGLFNFLASHPDQFALALATNSLPALLVSNPSLLDELAYAENGKLGLTLSPESNIAFVTLNLAKGTIIDTGTSSPEIDFAGIATNNFATGTFLQNYTSFLSPNQTFTLDGYAMPVQGNFGATYTASYSMYGTTASITTSFTATGLVSGTPTYAATLGGSLQFLGGSSVNVTGSINNTGTWSINGTGSFVIGGFTLASGQVKVVPQGISASGNVNLGTIGTATFTSTLSTSLNFTLTATAQTNFGIVGMPNATTTLTLNNSGMTGSSTVEFLGQQASLSGSIQTNLTYSLTGTVNASFSVLGITPSATAIVTLSNGGGATSLSGTFNLLVSASTLVANVSLDLLTTVYLAFAGFNIPTYSGTATVTGTVGVFSVSTSASVGNNSLVFTLPLIGSISIPLPF